MAIPEVGVVGRGGWPRPRRPAPPKRGSLQSSTAPICHGCRPWSARDTVSSCACDPASRQGLRRHDDGASAPDPL